MSRFTVNGFVLTASVAAIAALASMTFYPGFARAASTAMALPDCLGNPQVKPLDVTIACGDGNFRVENIQWTGWGEPFAAGMGTATVNDCKPYCAAGHFHSYPAILIANGMQRCPNGQKAYAKVTYAFIGRSPYPENAQSSKDAVVPFPCGPRK
jgi:hypothetical protein